ncbi:MAG: excinuclease ABC subunit UvrC [Desulfarculaceae bacterium]
MEASSKQAAPRGAEAIKAALAGVPQQPGVYLMKNAKGQVVYVGKAKRLRSRLSSYAREIKAPSFYRHKVQTMVSKVASVDFVVTNTEKEALILENSLIKRHRPRYNVDLRDDKNYLMLRLSLEHEFPRLSLVRKSADDGARYFGPFDKAGAARQTLYMLQRIFPLRRCTDYTLKNRSRPCLDFDTGRCTAPCTGQISQEDYRCLAQQMEAFFSGKGQKVAGELKRLMTEASNKEHYEQAAVYRDRLQALERTLERQRVAKATGEDQDVLALHQDQGLYRLAWLKVRAGRVVASRVHDLSQAALSPGQVMAQALLMLYDQAVPPPPLLLVSHMPPDPGLVVEVLGERAGRKVEIHRPQRGEKRGLLDLAMLNAVQPRQARAADLEGVLTSLAKKLGLKEPPQYLECVDISHLGGKLTVASLAAFKDGERHKEGYRRYKILSLDQTPDDYAAMSEVVSRRLKGDRPPPDLLLLDGGKGQLNVAQAVLKGLPPEMRPALAALAKGRQGAPDRVYLPGRKNAVNFKPHDAGLLLLMQLRDEAHRFAVTYHRLLRRKRLTKSILEEVPGVGPKRSRKLLKAFGSLAALKAAAPGEIAEKGGVDAASAERITGFLAALDSVRSQK